MRTGFVILSVWLSCCPLFGSIEQVLSPDPDWSRLDALQGKITRERFEQVMDQVYAPNSDWRIWIALDEAGARVATGDDPEGERYLIRFADAVRSKPARGRSLAGLRIALDPGHIGGAWGPMEERSFRVNGQAIVQEGDLVLAACQRIAARLRELGAETLLVRENAEPVTRYRPEDFRDVAAERLSGFSGEAAEKREAEQLLEERFFYRTAEIRARAAKLEKWNPDLAIALHVNASGAADPENAELHDQNDCHILVNGCYLPEEIADPSQRCEMLWRVLNDFAAEEHELAFEMKRSMREATNLPAYVYTGNNAKSLDIEDYIYARNLLANRIYDCPVVYLEPWQANSQQVYAWAAAGDYEGEREFGGEMRKSLPATYADFVVQGLIYRYGR